MDMASRLEPRAAAEDGPPRDDLSEPLMTRKEVMRLLNLSDVSMWRWLRAGKIEHVRLGRRVLFRRRAVEDVLRRGYEAARAFASRGECG